MYFQVTGFAPSILGVGKLLYTWAQFGFPYIWNLLFEIFYPQVQNFFWSLVYIKFYLFSLPHFELFFAVTPHLIISYPFLCYFVPFETYLYDILKEFRHHKNSFRTWKIHFQTIEVDVEKGSTNKITKQKYLHSVHLPWRIHRIGTCVYFVWKSAKNQNFEIFNNNES